MRKLSLCMVIVIGFILSSVSLIQAISFDNSKQLIKDTNMKYGKIDIKNAFGYGDKIASVELLENTESCSNNCYAILNLTLYKKSSFLDEIKFESVGFNNQRSKYNIKDYKFYLASNTKKQLYDYCYLNEITNTTQCEKRESNNPLFEEFNPNIKLPSGNYLIKLTGSKNKGEKIDWLIKTQGVWLDEWAIWGTIAQFVYDDFADDAVNSSLWSSSLATGATLTEASNRLELSTSWSNPNGVRESSFTAINLNYSKSINNVTLNVSLAAESNCFADGTAVSYFYVFNSSDAIYSAGSSGASGSSLVASWTFVRNNSETDGFIVYKDGAFNKTTTFTNLSNIVFYGKVYGNVPGACTVTATTSVSLFRYSTGGITQIISPANNYLSSSRQVGFNCSATLASGTLVNMSLFTNSSGTFTLNKTESLSGSSGSVMIYQNFTDESSVLWSCMACDNSGNCGIAEENRTVSIDTIPPSITINYPNGTYNYGYPNLNVTVNASITSGSSCWFTYNNTNYTLNCANPISSFLQDNDVNTLTVYANDTAGNLNSSVKTWLYTIYQYANTYNATTYETQTQSFIVNASGMSSASLNYDGTSYTASISGNIATKSLSIPQVTSTTNKTFFWMFNGGVINSSLYNQTVYPINLSLCSGANNISYLNFTFKDENTNSALNGSFDVATFYYQLNSGSTIKTLSYANPGSYTGSYSLCFSPPSESVLVNGSVQYAASGYPQRTYTLTPTTFTNTTTNTTLYLLSTADGIYSSFQTVTSSQSRIAGVNILVERVIGLNYETVGVDTTDDSGVATFWLNPNYDHRITATASGYTTNVVTIRPTQSTYTLVMSGSGTSSNMSYTSPIPGIKWISNRGSGTLKVGTYSIQVNVTDSQSSLENCKFELIDMDNATILATTTSLTNSSFCSLTNSVTVIKGQKIFGRVSVDTTSTDGFVIIDTDYKWSVFDDNARTWISTTSLLDEIFDSPEFGDDQNRAEYSRMMFFFIFATIVLGVFIFFTGAELQSPGITILITTSIVWIASIGGLLSFDSGSDNILPVFEKYGLALIWTLYGGGFALNQWRKTE